MSRISSLARQKVQQLVPYASARLSMSGGSVWLNANENSMATDYALSGQYNRYPDCQPKEVISAYADYAGVATNQVLTSRGADEGIELLIRSFCEPGQDAISICPPTYGMYKISAESQLVDVNIVPLTQELTLDLPTLFAQKANVKLVFICSPNNPTGDLIPRQQIVEVLEFYKDKALVVVDEAYIEFAPEASVAGLLNQYSNLVVLRTLSKAFALAGLRCGFTLAEPSVIAALRQMIAPYPVPAPVAEIAVQALSSQGQQKMRATVEQINSLRDSFSTFAGTLSYVSFVYPSKANYVLLCVPDAAELVSFIAEQGVLIRNQSSQLGLGQVVRVSIGSADEMAQLQQIMSSYSLTPKAITTTEKQESL
ncbi:MAG: histidinol-phosphate transaminase [Chromatiales bacterium RIFOXYA1_FULL_46_5]|nr:MAG: histidinol-phosphate transaminase [Chromatiales bacterium RIFOXYA1_FULL_46_5]